MLWRKSACLRGYGSAIQTSGAQMVHPSLHLPSLPVCRMGCGKVWQQHVNVVVPNSHLV